MANMAGKPSLPRLENQEESKEELKMSHCCSWSAPCAIICQDYSSACYF